MSRGDLTYCREGKAARSSLLAFAVPVFCPAQQAQYKPFYQ